MEEKQKAKLPTGQTVKWKNQDCPSVYANIMGFGLSPFDITIIFGEIGEATPTEVNAIPKAKITLAPEQAVNLMKLLGLITQTFVENNGPLRNAGAVDVEAIAKEVKSQLTKVG